MSNLVLYVMDGCPFCAKVLNYLENKNIPVLLKKINLSEEYRKELVDNGGKSQVPCLIINGNPLYESGDIIDWFKNNPRIND